MFVCLLTGLFFLFKSSWNSHRNIPWIFCKDPTWFGWDIQDLKMFIFFLFVCLFVDLFVVFFLFKSSWNSHRNIPWQFWKIPLDLAEILWIRKLDWKMLICLFVCLFVYIYIFALIIVEYTKEVSLKISWGLDLIWLRY